MKSLKLSLLIALRFLKSEPVQSFFIMGGIAIGITTQIFVGTLIMSLQSSLIDQTIGTSPQITLRAVKSSDPIVLNAHLENALRTKTIEQSSVLPVRTTTALYSNDTESTSLSLIGGTLEDLDGVYRVTDHLVTPKTKLGPTDIFLGKDFATAQKVKLGDSITLRMQTGGTQTFNVAGIFDIGSAVFNERQAFVSGETVRHLLGWSSEEYSAVQAQFIDPFASKDTVAWLKTQFPELKITEWQGQNADLLKGLTSQSMSSYLIQGFVLVAIAIGIASTLAVAAVQKMKQIGILKAMGMSDGSAGAIFFFQALGLGIGGSTMGVVLSLLAIKAFGLMPATFTIVLEPGLMAGSWVIGILVAMLSSVVPIVNTTRLDPIEVIQNG